MNYIKLEKIRKILLIVASIACIVGLFLSYQHNKKQAHDPEDIKIKLISSDSRYDNNNYYVYMDFKIKNNTGATIDYLRITTYFSDKNGKSIGTMDSTYGAAYSSSALNLKASESVTKETYLSVYKSAAANNNLFTQLYLNGIDDMVITYEITEVRWADEYTYER